MPRPLNPLDQEDTSRWRRRKEARPAELIAAALDLFVEKGFAATRLDEVAARAGVSKGTVYLYFASKEDLFKAAVREGVIPRIALAEQQIEDDTSSAADILGKILSDASELNGDTQLGGLLKLLVAEARNFPDLARFYHEEVISRSTVLFTALLKRGIERGEFRQFDVPAMVHIILAPFLLRAIWKHSLACCETNPVPEQTYVTEAVTLILNGLRVQDAQSAERNEESAKLKPKTKGKKDE